MNDDDILYLCGDIGDVAYEMLTAADAGDEWLRPFVSRLEQFKDDLRYAADKHLPREARS